MPKEVVHPEFESLIENEEDSFWKSLLIDLSHGRCPRGTYFYKKRLYFGKKSSIPLTSASDDPLFIDKLKEGFSSVNVSNPRCKKTMMTDNNDEKKSVRTILGLHSYVEKLKREYNLTDEEKRKVSKKLRIWFLLKYQGSKDIVKNENGDIVSINGIEWDEGKRKVKNDRVHHSSITSSTTIMSEKKDDNKGKLPESIMSGWDKFV